MFIRVHFSQWMLLRVSDCRCGPILLKTSNFFINPLQVGVHEGVVLVVALQTTGVIFGAATSNAHNLNVLILTNEQRSTRVTVANTLWGVLRAKLSVAKEIRIEDLTCRFIIHDQFNLAKDIRLSVVVVNIYEDSINDKCYCQSEFVIKWVHIKVCLMRTNLQSQQL